MRFNSNFPPVCFPSSSRETDAEHAGNKRAAETSPPLNAQPENKKLRRSFSFPSPLQKWFMEENNSGAFLHYDKPFAPGRRNNPPAAPQIHRETFIPFNSKNEIASVEKKVTDSIKGYLSEIKRDVLVTSRFDAIVQHYVNCGLNELEQKFEHALQNIIPGQSPDRLRSAREQAKEHIMQSANEASRSEGWELPLRQENNVTWESGPILIKRGLSLQQLKLDKADIANGGFGSVSIFENGNGDKLIGKISNNNMPEGRGGIRDDLADELQAYRAIYDTDNAGPHPNLVNAYGIAEVLKNGEMQRTLLMDAIPGPTGKKVFDVLRKCWDAGKISSEEYWGAVQFIGRRLLDVTEHIAKAGVVHNDIKPDNFLVNKETGEPILIDLGCCSGKDELRVGHTERYAAPEVKYYEGVDERSDVFTVGASLLDGVERGEVKKPNEGIRQQNAFMNEKGKMVRTPGTYSVKTDYTEFISKLLEENKDGRVDSEKAKELDFLKHMMLDDDAAKEVIKKAISLASEEEKKPGKEQWKRERPRLFPRKNRLMAALKNNPDLDDSANLSNASKDDKRDALDRRNRRLARRAKLQNTKPKKILDRNALNFLLGPMVKESVMRFITDATWFDDAQKILETVPQKVKSGVDRNGVHLNSKTEPDDELYPEYKRSVMNHEHYKGAVISARQNLASHVETEKLRRYVTDAEGFLLDAGILKARSDDEITRQIEQVRERASVARRIVEIFDADLSKPEEGAVRERAPGLESVPLSWQSKKENFQERSHELERLIKHMNWPNNPPASE